MVWVDRGGAPLSGVPGGQEKAHLLLPLPLCSSAGAAESGRWQVQSQGSVGAEGAGSDCPLDFHLMADHH